MGYNGTESADELMLRYAGKQSGMMNHEERLNILQEIEDRLYIIKLEMGLLPPEELREIARRRAETDSEEREREERLRQGHLQKLADERAEIEREEAEERLRIINEMLQGLGLSFPRSREALQTGIQLADKSRAPKIVAEAIRSFIHSKGASFVSYLDGSSHLSIDELDFHNATERDRVAREASGVAVLPSPQTFDTASLKAAEMEKDRYRVEYDASRVRMNASHMQRLRIREQSLVDQNAIDAGEAEQQRRLDDALDRFNAARDDYNRQAAAAAERVVSAAVTRSRMPKAQQKSASVPATQQGIRVQREEIEENTVSPGSEASERSQQSRQLERSQQSQEGQQAEENGELEIMPERVEA